MKNFGEFKYVLLVVLIVLPTILADDFPISQQNKNASLVVSCQNSSYSNISSIQFPNGTFIIKAETSMTKYLNNNYNYTLSSLNTYVIGDYVVSYHCDLNGVDTVVQANLPITYSGYDASLPKIVMMFIIIGLLILVSIFGYLYGINSKYIPVKIFTLGLSASLVVFTIGYILNMVNISIGEFTNLTSLFSSFYILSTVIMIGVGITLVVYVLVYAFQLFYKSKGYEVGELM